MSKTLSAEVNLSDIKITYNVMSLVLFILSVLWIVVALILTIRVFVNVFNIAPDETTLGTPQQISIQESIELVETQTNQIEIQQ